MNNSLAIPALPILASIFLIFSLSGCINKPDIDTISSKLHIPPQMLQCEDAGPRPTGEVILESQVARYISTLEYVNKDCKTRLKELSVVIECFNDKDCNPDALIKYIGLVKETKER